LAKQIAGLHGLFPVNGLQFCGFVLHKPISAIGVHGVVDIKSLVWQRPNLYAIQRVSKGFHLVGCVFDCFFFGLEHGLLSFEVFFTTFLG
jgi:hypothetical protein